MTIIMSTYDNMHTPQILFGEYKIGFKLLFTFDHSRTFKQRWNYKGEENSTIISRPVQIGLWYPVDPKINESTMVFGQYILPLANELGESFPPEEQRTKAMRKYTQLLHYARPDGFSDEELEQLMKVSTTSLYNPPIAEGEFPLVIGTGWRNFANSTLNEILASHGYIVAQNLAIGHQMERIEINVQHTELIARDIEFIVAKLRSEIPSVHHSKLAICQFSFGSTASLLTANRNMNVDAIVSLDGWESYKQGLALMEKTSYFKPKSMKTPMLIFSSDEFSTQKNFTLRDQYTNSDRYTINLKNYNHADLLSNTYHILSEASQNFPRYLWICQLLLKYLNYYVKLDPNGLSQFKELLAQKQNNFEYEYQPGIGFPNEYQVFQPIFDPQQGISVFKQVVDELQKVYPNEKPFGEWSMNNLAYDQFFKGNLDTAYELLKVNLVVYPESYNTWDSMGEIYAAKGERDLAIQHYEKSIELNPENKAGMEILNRLKSE